MIARAIWGGATLLVAALALAPAACGDQPTFAALESKLSAALAAGDARTADALADPALTFVNPAGHVAKKAKWLSGVTPPGAGPQLTSRNDSVEVMFEDEHTAVVVVRSTWKYGDSPGEPYLATHVWLKRETGWRLVSAQVAKAAP